MKAQLAKLPNGMEVYSKRAEEALLMYGEVGDYLKHGLTLQPGATVVDVGANIGMFSLWAYEQCAGDITIYAFEPLAPIFELLEANFKKIAPQQLHALNIGLSQQAGEVTFAYYPNATFASTAYPDSSEADRQLTRTLLARSLHQLPPPLHLIQHLPNGVQKPIISGLAWYINQRRMEKCQLQTLSAIIAQYHMTTIDFLKIDAEKSELDVLRGINASDWAKVQQVFIEVHDREDRVAIICQLLSDQGFQQVIHEQDPFFANTDIHAIYARRL